MQIAKSYLIAVFFRYIIKEIRLKSRLKIMTVILSEDFKK